MRVAPDGRHVYMAKGGAMTKSSHVVRIDLQTGEEKEICAAMPSVWALSPDGKQIACAGHGDGIQILQTQGGTGRDLVKGAQFGPMAWTADGTHLIYTIPAPGAGPGGAGIYWMIPTAGGTPRRLDLALDRVGLMSIHPDNRHIAISPGGSTTEVWVLQNLLHASK
jgi:Tol biopolymer transport system component